MEETKACITCKLAKTLNCFHKSKNKPDGLSSYCKECTSSIKKLAYQNMTPEQKVKKEKTDKRARAKQKIAKAAVKALTAKVNPPGFKTCSNCKNCQPLTSFNKNKRSKDGLCGECKDCAKARANANYQSCDKIARNNQKKAYRKSNKEKTTAANMAYAKKNATKISAYQKEYYAKNKPAIRKKNNENESKRLKTDPVFKLRKSVSLHIRLALQNNKSSKRAKSIMNYLPYTIEQLKQHLESLFESWMTWNNWGTYKANKWNDNDSTTWTWQIDHITPQSDLPYQTMEDQAFKDCWRLDNLRPYSAKQNVLDGTNKVRHKKND